VIRPLLALSLAAAFSALGAPGTGPSSEPRIDNLAVRRADGQLLVTFDVSGALDAEAMERVQSGLPLAYRHTLEIVGRRPLPLWPSRVLARARIDVQVHYDSLTRRYDLTREVHAERRRAAPEADVDTRSTESVETMRAWMTRVEDFPLVEPEAELEPERLRLRVETSLGRRYVMLVFPDRVTVSAERELGF
jgi:hypothetical protein